METSLWSVLVLIFAVIGSVVNAANKDGEVSKRSTSDPLEQRLHNLEGELQRVKSHLSNVENLLDAWFLNAEQQPSMIVNGGGENNGNAGWIAELNGGKGDGYEKRGAWAFMGSRGKRKQPFILGSRGKRAVNYDLVDTDDFEQTIENDKRANQYFYGSRGKKAGSLDDSEYRIPPYTNKRYQFMGSRGKK